MNLRHTFLEQPRKIFRNPILRYSNGSNRTTFKVKTTPVIEKASNGELPSKISNLWKPIGFTVTVRRRLIVEIVTISNELKCLAIKIFKVLNYLKILVLDILTHKIVNAKH